MKELLIQALLVLSILFSCEQEKVTPGYPESLLNHKTILVNDTLDFSFGFFGDEEGISIISYPKNALVCELLNKPWEERILRYVPKQDYLGTDTIEVKTMRGSDGASPSSEIDTTTLIVTVVYNDFHSKLIGKWQWFESCGGVTGGCWYPEAGKSTVVEFTSTMLCNSYGNDELSSSHEYSFLESFTQEDLVIYKISFENGYSTFYWFEGDRLCIQGGDFVENYRKVQ